jgi:hypothetical protein
VLIQQKKQQPLSVECSWLLIQLPCLSLSLFTPLLVCQAAKNGPTTLWGPPTCHHGGLLQFIAAYYRERNAERRNEARQSKRDVAVRRAPRWRRAGLAVEAPDAELLRRPPGELQKPCLLLIRPLLADLGNIRRRRCRAVAEGGPLRAHAAKVVAACCKWRRLCERMRFQAGGPTTIQTPEARQSRRS